MNKVCFNLKSLVLFAAIWLIGLGGLAQAGALQVELTVRDDVGMDRVAEPVTSGVPIPMREGLRDSNGFRITTQDGRPIPAQFTVLARWNGRVADEKKPIQWVLVDFQADVPANGASKYLLKWDPESPRPQHPQALRTSQDKYLLGITTGPMWVGIDTFGSNILDNVWLDVNGDGRFDDEEALVRMGNDAYDGAVLTDTFGVKYYGGWGTKSVVIEDAGPLHMVVKIEGRHRTPGNQEGLPIGFYDYLVRVHFYAGKSFVKVHYTLKNSPPCPVELDAGSNCRDPLFGPLAFKDFSIETVFNLRQDRSYKVFGERLYQGNAARFRLYQDSSGGPNWNSYHTNAGYVLQVAHDRNRELWDMEGGPSFRGFKAYENENEIDSGNKAQGWMDVSDGKWGVMTQIRHFWQQSPKSIEINGNRLSIGLWPRHYNGIHWLDDQMHKTHEMLYAFHLSKFNPENTAQSFNSPLFATAPTQWYNDARVIGPFGDLLTLNPEERSSHIPLNRSNIGSRASLDAYRDAQNYWGWIPFGDTKGDPSGAGCPCIEPSTFSLFLQTFNRDTFDLAEELARQWMDTRAFHRDQESGDINNNGVNNVPPDRSPYWVGTHNQGWLWPDENHAYFSNLYEYYLLTGNRKAIEAAHELASAIKRLGFWWHFTRDTQPFPIERAYGWMLYEFMRMYEITGEIGYLDDAERVIKKAYDQTDKRRGNLLYAYAYTPGSARAGTYIDGPRVNYDYAAKTWQTGIALMGVGKYADVVLNNNISRSLFTGEDARDFATGLADLLAYEVFRPDVPIFPEDWFLTYPQPPDNVLFPYGTYNAIEHQITAGLSITHRLTGDPTYQNVAEAMVRKWGGRTDVYFQTAITDMQRAVSAPNPVTDLRATATGNGNQIQLTWTRPSNVIGTVRYKVKYADRPIVRRIDCRQTNNCYDPCVINGYQTLCPRQMNQMTYWGATRAEDVVGSDNSQTHQFTIGNLETGRTYYFVVRVEDETHTLSELSNVAVVTP